MARGNRAGLRSIGPAAVGLIGLGAAAAQPAPDPFAFLQPVATLSADDRRAIDRGEARVRIVPGTGREVAVLAIVAVKIDADRLAAWVRRIEAMKKSPAVQAIGRFSDPPRLDDLAALSLGADDLDAIRSCRPGRCGLKLAAAEMARLQAAIAGGAGDWRPRAQQEFRRLVLDRVDRYRAEGRAVLAPYDDDRPPRPAGDAFADLLRRSRPLTDRVNGLTAALSAPPRAAAGLEQMLYWSIERFGGKPVVSATDVRFVRPREPALPLLMVAGAQIFATHYMNGSLNLTMLLAGRPGGPNYFVYLNRSDIDIISGMLGGIARGIIERRLRGEAGELVEALRGRLEGGPPKDSSVPDGILSTSGRDAGASGRRH